MAYATINEAVSDLNLWFKQRSDDPLTLADVPSILPLRWSFFRDSWDFIKDDLIDSADSTFDSDLLNRQVSSLSDFIAFTKISLPNTNPFSNSKVLFRFYEVFDNILIEDININQAEQNLIDTAQTRVSLFTRDNFLDIRAMVVKERDALADVTGGNDDDYDRVFSRSAAAAQRDIEIDDITMMASLNNTIDSVNFILANAFAISTSTVDPFELARINANNPDIDIGQYSSGTLIRFNYGESLEVLAAKYLGDPDKWLDIAIANGLKPPYIDEVGEVLSMTANGKDSQLSISKLDASNQPNINKLYVNQSVIVRSDTYPVAERRIVINVKEIPISGDIIIELSGDPDLGRYKTSENATLRVFKPNTVNSGFFILIPSNEPIDTVRKDDVPWFLTDSEEDEKRMQVDLLIDDDGDLRFTPTNDLQLSYGLANAIQAIKLKLMVELGSLIRHSNFGLVAVQGKTNADIDQIRIQLIDSITRSIQEDDRFDRIETLSVKYTKRDTAEGGGVAFLINLTVRLAGGGRVIPISFSVSTSSQP